LAGVAAPRGFGVDGPGAGPASGDPLDAGRIAHPLSPSSISDRRPGRPARVVDPEEVAVAADPDQLDRAPGRLFGEPIAALGERRESGGKKAPALVIKRIRHPWVMKA